VVERPSLLKASPRAALRAQKAGANCTFRKYFFTSGEDAMLSPVNPRTTTFGAKR
jgi:hypothetical protein